jgi:hypothetical protein
MSGLVCSLSTLFSLWPNKEVESSSLHLVGFVVYLSRLKSLLIAERTNGGHT